MRFMAKGAGLQRAAIQLARAGARARPRFLAGRILAVNRTCRVMARDRARCWGAPKPGHFFVTIVSKKWHGPIDHCRKAAPEQKAVATAGATRATPDRSNSGCRLGSLRYQSQPISVRFQMQAGSLCYVQKIGRIMMAVWVLICEICAICGEWIVLGPSGSLSPRPPVKRFRLVATSRSLALAAAGHSLTLAATNGRWQPAVPWLRAKAGAAPSR